MQRIRIILSQSAGPEQASVFGSKSKGPGTTQALQQGLSRLRFSGVIPRDPGPGTLWEFARRGS